MAIDRYNSATILQDADTGQRYYSDIIVPTIPPADSDLFIISREGDRLDSIAARVYGDSTLWWVVAEANGLNDSFYIPPGTRLRIPANSSNVLSLMTDVNNSR